MNGRPREEIVMQIRTYYPALLGLALLVAFLNACRPGAPSPTSADRKALAAIVQEIDAAYNAQDAARFSAVFAEDGNFQFPVEGTVLHGRDEIRQHFAKQFATLPPLRHVTTTGEINLIGSGILAVDIQVEILAIDPRTGAAQTLAHYDGLSLGIRKDSGWRIRLVRLYPAAKSPAAR
jgi:uncharacterized protein (TIGR02246 family)